MWCADPTAAASTHRPRRHRSRAATATPTTETPGRTTTRPSQSSFRGPTVLEVHHASPHAPVACGLKECNHRRGCERPRLVGVDPAVAWCRWTSPRRTWPRRCVPLELCSSLSRELSGRHRVVQRSPRRHGGHGGVRTASEPVLTCTTAPWSARSARCSVASLSRGTHRRE